MAPGKNDHRQTSMRKSIVVQRNILRPVDANSAFSSTGDEVPVVLVPLMQPSFCHFSLTVPSGVYVLYQHWHAHAGMLQAGAKFCWPSWYRVSHIVTAASMTYCAPIKGCPTSDNVMVDVDLSLTFQIGPTEVEAERFVYSLGAARFDELLSALTDEGLRGLIYCVPHDKLHDLREDFATGLLRSLNRTLSGYGVQVHNVKITEVMLPAIVENTLQDATAFTTRMEEQEKKHENSMKKLEDTAALELTAVEQRMQRLAQDIQAKKNNALIKREQQKVDAAGVSAVAVTEAQQHASVARIQAEAEAEAAQKRAERQAAEMLSAVQSEVESRMVAAQQAALNSITRAEAEVAKARAVAAIIDAKGNAEAGNAESLERIRLHELEMRRLEVLKGLACTSKLVVSGDTGESLLQNIIPGSAHDLSANVAAEAINGTN